MKTIEKSRPGRASRGTVTSILMLLFMVHGSLEGQASPSESGEAADRAGVVVFHDPPDDGGCTTRAASMARAAVRSGADGTLDTGRLATGRLATGRLDTGLDPGTVIDRPPIDPGPLPRRSRVFTFLAHESPADVRIARRLTRSAFEAEHRHLTDEGFHLDNFEVVREGSTPCFSGVWASGAKRQLLELGQDKRLFAATFLGAALDGLGGRDLETYVHDGERRFAGLWQEGEPGSAVLLEASLTELRAEQARGRLIYDLESWFESGQQRFLGLHRTTDVETRLAINLTMNQLEERTESLTASGFRPRELEIVSVGGKARVNMVWDRSEDAFWLFVGTSEAAQDCRLLSLRVEAPALQPGLPMSECRGLGRPVIIRPTDTGIDEVSMAKHDRASSTPPPRALPPPRDPPRPGRPKPSSLGPLGLSEEPVPPMPLHIVDFHVTRIRLDVSEKPGDVAHFHQGVIHESGSSGPGT